MPRIREPPLPVDLEIEKTVKALRKEAKFQRQQGEEEGEPSKTTLEPQVNIEVEENMAAQGQLVNNRVEQTVQDYYDEPIVETPLCIVYPRLEGTFELKSSLYHLLPTFHGLASEDPYQHLKDFQAACSTSKPNNMTEEHLKLRVFPFTVKDAAKQWLFDLPSGSITEWGQLSKSFLKKFFPASRASDLRRQISNATQGDAENLHDYWERFKRLLSSCPQHKHSPEALINYFYEGLCEADQRMLDSAANGALLEKRAVDARALIDKMAENSRQFKNTRRVNEVSDSNIQSQLNQLTAAVSSLVSQIAKPAVVCQICFTQGHHNDQCPLVQEENGQVNQVNYMRPQQNFNQSRYDPPRQGYDPYSNTYNPGWRDHPSFSYKQPEQNQGNNRLPAPQQILRLPAPQQADSSKNLENLFAQLAADNKQFQETTQASIRNLELQMGQLATTVGKLNTQGKLPSQTETNPRETVCAITLRSEKEVQQPEVAKISHEKEKATDLKLKSQVVCDEPESSHTKDSNLESEFQRINMAPKEKEKENKNKNESEKGVAPLITPIVVSPLFRARLSKSRKVREDKEILEIFRKVEVNIPLLDLLKKTPQYTKFLKEYCTHKKKIGFNEDVSTAFNKQLPPKCSDQGMFSIPCQIGSLKIQRAMCDLGASINVMPLSVYNSLSDAPLKQTSTIIQLADRSTVSPVGLLEDVLVKVNDLIFPADFYVLDMGNDNSSNSSQLLLGRPFLSTAKTKIDVFQGKITMEFNNNKVGFNVYDILGSTNDVFSVPSKNTNEMQANVDKMQDGRSPKKKSKNKLKVFNHPVYKEDPGDIQKPRKQAWRPKISHNDPKNPEGVT